MNQFTGIIGISALLGIAYLLSENKKAINYRTVMWGLVLQFVFALLILKTPIGKPLFSYVDRIINRLISFADKGSEFVFGSQAENIGFHPAFESVAFRLLPTIIFFSALISILYHYGVIQFVVKIFMGLIRLFVSGTGLIKTKIV